MVKICVFFVCNNLRAGFCNFSHSKQESFEKNMIDWLPGCHEGSKSRFTFFNLVHLRLIILLINIIKMIVAKINATTKSRILKSPIIYKSPFGFIIFMAFEN